MPCFATQGRLAPEGFGVFRGLVGIYRGMRISLPLTSGFGLAVASVVMPLHNAAIDNDVFRLPGARAHLWLMQSTSSKNIATIAVVPTAGPAAAISGTSSRVGLEPAWPIGISNPASRPVTSASIGPASMMNDGEVRIAFESLKPASASRPPQACPARPRLGIISARPAQSRRRQWQP